MKSATAQPGDFRIVNVRDFKRRCLGVAVAALFAGLFIGAYASHAVFASDQSPVARALVDVGDYLCKQWGGLADIGRVDPTHYAFRCHDLATFPRVEITIAENH